MRNFLLATVAGAALISGSAFAADLPVRTAAPAFVAPVSAYSWSGFYVGGQIGGAWTSASVTPYIAPGFVGAGAGVSVSPSGVVGGLHAGFNWQMSQVVLGLEGDAELSGVSGSTAVGGGFIRDRDDFRGSIRARLGFAVDRALIYATGGVAFQNFKSTNTLGAVSSSYSTSRTGWTLGGGIEFAINNQWSVRGEYRYSDFGRWGYNTLAGDPLLPAGSIRQRLTDSSVRIGVSYHFNAPASSVVARY